MDVTFRENESFYPPTFGACHPSSSTTPISRIGREGENVVGRDVLIQSIPVPSLGDIPQCGQGT